MSSRITLPGLATVTDHSREPLTANAPTWARRRVAPGQYERLRLERIADHIAADGARSQVWVVPAAASSPGDDIEFGPTPPGVRVHVETTDQYEVTSRYAPAAYPRPRV